MRWRFAAVVVVSGAFAVAGSAAHAAPRDVCIPPPKQSAGHHALCQFMEYCRLAGVNASEKNQRQCIIDQIHWYVFMKKRVGAYVHYHSKPNKKAQQELRAFKYDRRHHRPTT